MENLNDVLGRLREIEDLLKDLRDFFLENHHWGGDNDFIYSINHIYSLINHINATINNEEVGLKGIARQIIIKIESLEEKILAKLNAILIDLRKSFKDSTVLNVIEYKKAMKSNITEVRNVTKSFNNFIQKTNFLSSAKKELTELKSKVHYFKKMQVGKDYFFSIQISYDDSNFIKLEIKNLDVISKELTIDKVPKKAEEGFIIRLNSPTMTINPPFRKIVIDSENKRKFKKHIYFKVSPNYSGNFIIIMEFILEDKIFFTSDEKFEVSVQDKGLEWKNRKKTHLNQVSASALKFFSINLSIFLFLGFDFFFQYLAFLVIASICFYFYARLKGYGWYRRIKIVEADLPKLLTITETQ